MALTLAEMRAAQAGEKPRGSFRKAFGLGIAAVGLFYGLLAIWLVINGGETYKKIEDGMPFQALTIERPPPVELYDYPRRPGDLNTAQAAPDIPATPHAVTSEAKSTVVVPTGPLEVAPLAGLYDSTPEGKLPKISDAGLKPFDAYKRPFVHQGRPVISLAIKDFGLSVQDSEGALELPPEVTLILSPYANDPDMWVKRAREKGHEIWLSLPLENERFLEEDPGPQALLTNGSLADNEKKLAWVLSRTVGYAGVVAETDQVFTQLQVMLTSLIKSIFKRGLGYLELNPEGSQLIETVAFSQNAPYAGIDKILSIYNENRFAEIEETANKKGSGLLVINLTPLNLEKVRPWTLSLEAKGFSMAPVSALAAATVDPSKEVAPGPDAHDSGHAPAAAHHE